MLTVLLIEDDERDIEASARQVHRAGENIPLELHVLWLTETKIEDEQLKEGLRAEWNVSHLYCVCRESLRYEALLEEAARVVEDLEPDIVITDLKLSVPGAKPELCGLEKIAGAYIYEGVQLTRDLDKMGLVSYFIWTSHHMGEVLNVRSGYMCELMDGTVPLVNIPLVVAIEKDASRLLSRSIRSLMSHTDGRFLQTQALYKIPQGNLIKLFTDFTDNYNLRHQLQFSLGKAGKDSREAFRLLRRFLRQLSQVTLTTQTTPRCRLGSLLHAYDKPWLDNAVKLVLERKEGVFKVDGFYPELVDEVKANLDELTVQLRTWLFCIPLAEVPELIEQSLRTLGKYPDISGRDQLTGAGGNLDFGARSNLIEIVLNVFKNALDHGTEVSCEIDLRETYLVIDVKNRLTEDSMNVLKRRHPSVFARPERGLKTVYRCVGGLNTGSRTMLDGGDLWGVCDAYRVDGKVGSNVYPEGFSNMIQRLTEEDGAPPAAVQEGFWWTRIYCPRMAADVQK
jgi:hypothetical protein